MRVLVIGSIVCVQSMSGNVDRRRAAVLTLKRNRHKINVAANALR